MELKERIYQNQAEILKLLADLISYPSIYTEDSPKYPFGEEIDKCLRKTLAICRDLGFKTFYGSGEYAYAEIGEGEEMLGILCHLDVVPAGDKNSWESPPFKLTKKNGKIFARGAVDDKGPLVAALYAVKLMLAENINFNKRIRFIFGLDEETLWRSINKYLENEEKPDLAFAPDSSFPLINAEKGLLQFKLISENNSKLKLKGGGAFNVVPDKITYKTDKTAELAVQLDDLSYGYEKEENQITVFGKSAHAAKPENGKNAITGLLKALAKIRDLPASINFYNNYIGEDQRAIKIFGDISDQESGALSINLAKIKITQDKEELFFDIRFPVTYQKEEIVNKLKDKIKAYNLKYVEHDYLAPLYVPEDHYLVQTLLNVYADKTGQELSPLSSGGATYARAIENCVAFGPVFPNEEKVEHQPNEFINLDSLFKCTEIYYEAINKLTR